MKEQENWSTGSSNTAIGFHAGQTITSGANNIAIGNQAQVAFATADNQVQIGNASIASVRTSGILTTGAVTYPNTDGTVGQVLTTDGSGTLSWTTAGGGVALAIGDSYQDGISFG